MKHAAALLMGLALSWVALSCARMGSPDGGWYDETPPHVLGATPADKGTEVTAKRMNIYFDEYIKLENASEKVVVSPPQLETPEITTAGRSIKINLIDSLKPNTTYTIDFSDAISDNNEGNPLGNYTYSFSTGDHIDTLEVSGHVLDAQNLEPVKGILVGLYADHADSAFRTKPMLRVSRTDSRGHFVVKGVAPGQYRVYALQDADGNYIYNQKSERIAFSHDIIEPSWKPDTRQDTIWRDSLHIDSIMVVPYTHFLPDDVVLRAFTETQTDRVLLKSERKKANILSLYYTYGHDSLPRMRGLNFNEQEGVYTEASLRRDTISYWLSDSLLINNDTLTIELTHHITDTAGVLQLRTDTLTMLSKEPYEKRMKKLEKDIEEWHKKQEKAKKRGLPYDSVMPTPVLEPKFNVPANMAPDQNIGITFETPLLKADSSMIHLYAKHDTLWYKARMELRKRDDLPRAYTVVGEWRPDVEYSLEVDSAAFTDIYGLSNKPYKTGIKVKSNDEFSSILVTVSGLRGDHIVAELLDASDKTVKTTRAERATVEFFYVTPGTYYLRIFEDDNDNGLWDTGCYDDDRQPENVYYYPEEIECKAKWDVTLPTWIPTQTPAPRQKPAKIVKQKADKQKTIRQRNAERAREKDIPLSKVPKEFSPYKKKQR